MVWHLSEVLDFTARASASLKISVVILVFLPFARSMWIESRLSFYLRPQPIAHRPRKRGSFVNRLRSDSQTISLNLLHEISAFDVTTQWDFETAKLPTTHSTLAPYMVMTSHQNNKCAGECTQAVGCLSLSSKVSALHSLNIYSNIS